MSKTTRPSSQAQCMHHSRSTCLTAWNKRPSVGSWLQPSLKKSPRPRLQSLPPSPQRATCVAVFAKTTPEPQPCWSRTSSVGTWLLPASCRSRVRDSVSMPPLPGARPAQTHQRPSQHVLQKVSASFEQYYRRHMLRTCGVDVLASLCAKCISSHQALGTSRSQASTMQSTAVAAGEGPMSPQVSQSLAETLMEPACGRMTLRQGSYSLLAHSELEARVASLVLTGGQAGGGSQSSSFREQLAVLPPLPLASLRDALPPALAWTPLRGEDSTAQMPQTPTPMSVPLPPDEKLKPVRRSFRRQSRPRDVLSFPIGKPSNAAFCSDHDVTCSDHLEQMHMTRNPLVLGGDLMTSNNTMTPRTDRWSAEWTSQNSLPLRYRFTRGSLADDSAKATEGGHQASCRGSDRDATEQHEKHEQRQQQQSSTLRLPPVQLGGQHRSRRFVAPASGVLSARSGSLRHSQRRAASLASSMRAQPFDS